MADFRFARGLATGTTSAAPMMIPKPFLCIAALLTLAGADLAAPSDGQASPAVRWSGTAAPIWFDLFGTDRTDWTNGVAELTDGDIATVGFVNRGDGDPPPSWDLLVRRYQPSGQLIWSRRLGGDGIDAGWALAESGEGGLAIAGAASAGPGGVAGTDVWLLVLDREGRIRVDRRFGGPDEDFATGIAAVPGGGFLISGWTRSMGAGNRDVLLIRTDSEGGEIWRRAYGGPGVDRGFYVRPVEGGFVVAGVTGEADSYDFLLMKVNERGDEVWRRIIGGPANDPTHGLVVRPDGRIVLVGYTRSWGSREYDLAALTFSADGELLGHYLLGSPGEDRAQSAALAEDGSIWITGYTRRDAETDWDILLARVRSDGSFEPWIAAIDSGMGDNGSTIALARNGDLLLGGYSAARSGDDASPDALVMRLRSDGVASSLQEVESRTVERGSTE